MNCNEAEQLVARYADGELDAQLGRTLAQHLPGCAACNARYQAILELRAHIRSEVPYFTAPEAFRSRLQAMLSEAGSPNPARRAAPVERLRWLAGGALAGCAATLLAWTIGTAVIDWRSNADIAVEAVSSHVRATLSNHQIEVASSDQHTVKPWLSARLDYSPPVQDLASEGFTLIGGRLDTLGKQRVATLVYHYKLHTIDVFVRPEVAKAQPALRNLHGFNVAHATGDGMDWLAVSDASPDVLSAFVQRLARSENGSDAAVR